ncbi:hypothetical protein [Arthrobacter oryzae]|uniref:hypothetical protein n=1 Tax=Arthrobacter oryzae TaxID=409290 RepID=UPI00273CF17D|nr:hypothetical protein [Arthrobacter oryzae]WLQ08760.1 hypothetical protein Q8Z05_17030 [Arthrobacter oryzae]
MRFLLDPQGPFFNCHMIEQLEPEYSEQKKALTDWSPDVRCQGRECLTSGGFKGWPDTPGVAWRGGLIMSGTMYPMATDVDQQ